MATDAATSSDWCYAMCPLETDPGRFGPFEDLVGLWRRRRGAGRRMPSRADFDAEDFVPWLGRIFIARVERDPFDLRFTLWGTRLRDWWRIDYTGRTLGELSVDPGSWEVERRYFSAMDRAPFLGIASGCLSLHQRSHIRVLGLDLPMSDGDGLAHVVSAHMEIGWLDKVRDILPDCPMTEFGEAAMAADAVP